MVGLRLHRQPARVFCRGGPGWAHRTRVTGGFVKPDANDLMPRLPLSWYPLDTAGPLRAPGLLGGPVDLEGVHIIALPFASLTTCGTLQGPDHLDLMLARSAHQQVHDHIATVDEVSGGSELALS